MNGSCRSKLDSPIDGTRCGPGKVTPLFLFPLWILLHLPGEKEWELDHVLCYIFFDFTLPFSGVSQESV